MTMGVLAALVSHAFTPANLAAIFTDRFLYIITIAVFAVSLLFRVLESRVKRFVDFLLARFPLKLVVFLLVVLLGLLSSMITAIIASLLLVEMVSILPLSRKNQVRVSIAACFSIGLERCSRPSASRSPPSSLPSCTRISFSCSAFSASQSSPACCCSACFPCFCR